MDPLPLLKRIENKEFVVGVIGLGYVGLPLTLTFGQAGFRTIGFDVDANKIHQLEKGQSYLRHISASHVQALFKQDLLSVTIDFNQVKNCDAVILAVPTPLNAHREPDMRFIIQTAESIAPHLHSGQVIVLESTTYPGTTDTLLRELLESRSKLTAGLDFYLAYSPEREDPGNKKFQTHSIPKLIGGFTPACREVTEALYRKAFKSVIPVSSTRVAEMAKLFENIFRSVNIALVNEIKTVCEPMGINVWEVIAAAASKPFGFMPFYPGPGLGGHCIPIDPFYLTWKARAYGLNTRFIELAGEINTRMPHYVVERSAEALNSRCKALNQAQVLILGVAYKPNIDDIRESPALKIIDLLTKQGAYVCYHDPFIPVIPKTRQYDLDLASTNLTSDFLQSMDLAIIVTDHFGVDYQLVADHIPLIVDTRNTTQNLKASTAKIFHA